VKRHDGRFVPLVLRGICRRQSAVIRPTHKVAVSGCKFERYHILFLPLPLFFLFSHGAHFLKRMDALTQYTSRYLKIT
jgi:hypothetical protein